jgi:oligoribonuclease
MIVTNAQLEVLGQSPVIVVHQSDAVLNGMDAWNKGTHGKSGLIDKVKASVLNDAEAEQQLLEWMRTVVGKSKSPMCGNTICQDRRFMAKWMPKLEGYFHYRNIDVSTLKELARRWKPGVVEGFKKQQAHTALADIIESIEELKHYRTHFIA